MRQFAGFLLCAIPFLLLVLLHVLPALPIIGDVVGEYLSRVPFDSAAWKEAGLGDDWNPVRLRMVDDLLGRHYLVGMEKAEIDDLLGAPSQTGKFGNYGRVYWLGPERSFFSVDSEWLGVRFEDDRVVEARIVRD